MGSFSSFATHMMSMTTNIGIDLSDLGLDLPSGSQPIEAPEPATPVGRNLVAGSTLAKALYSVWSGEAITVVDSPPGAGKTTTVAELVAHLVERSDIKMVIACPTRRGAYDMAERIGQTLGPDKKGEPQVALSVNGMNPPPGVAKGGTSANTRIPVVRTIASCKSNSRPNCELMIIDEAYQATFADVSNAADNADQILMVGDPGQIGPVVTADVSAFRGKDQAPHMRAPEVFVQKAGAVVHRLGTTYRLGQETVDAIAPLYNFPFTSSRPDRYLTDENGNRVSEIIPLKIPVAPSFQHMDTMVTVAEYAANLVGTELVETTRDGVLIRRPLETTDIAIVVAHNAQRTAIQAILRDKFRIEGIVADTADSLQGGQWHAVVALDPFVGYTSAGTHQLSPGRLCVMASRAMSFLAWVHDGAWEQALMTTEIDEKEAQLGLKVRYALTAV